MTTHELANILLLNPDMDIALLNMNEPEQNIYAEKSNFGFMEIVNEDNPSKKTQIFGIIYKEENGKSDSDSEKG